MSQAQRSKQAYIWAASLVCLLRSERIMRTATNISNDNLALLGTCFGRFTKSKRFRLKVTCLEILAKYALVSHAQRWQLDHS